VPDAIGMFSSSCASYFDFLLLADGLLGIKIGRKALVWLQLNLSGSHPMVEWCR